MNGDDFWGLIVNASCSDAAILVDAHKQEEVDELVNGRISEAEALDNFKRFTACRKDSCLRIATWFARALNQKRETTEEVKAELRDQLIQHWHDCEDNLVKAGLVFFILDFHGVNGSTKTAFFEFLVNDWQVFQEELEIYWGMESVMDRVDARLKGRKFRSEKNWIYYLSLLAYAHYFSEWDKVSTYLSDTELAELDAFSQKTYEYVIDKCHKHIL